MNAEKLLKKIRGNNNVCGCGKKLIPVISNGIKIGLQHKTVEDEDYHNKYFCSFTVKIKD